jgi:hypothetical protein
MATSILNSVSVRLNLNNGFDHQTGQINTVAIYLPRINTENYDPDKALVIAEALAPCLTKSLYSVQEIKSSTITHNH